MSLEVHAAEGRFHRLHRLTERVDFLDIELDVEHVDVGETLEQHALPSMTGFDADAPMSPRPRTADPFETTATGFPSPCTRTPILALRRCRDTAPRPRANTRATGLAGCSSASWSRSRSSRRLPSVILSRVVV